jgi:hypothetical protein
MNCHNCHNPLSPTDKICRICRAKVKHSVSGVAAPARVPPQPKAATPSHNGTAYPDEQTAAAGTTPMSPNGLQSPSVYNVLQWQSMPIDPLSTLPGEPTAGVQRNTAMSSGTLYRRRFSRRHPGLFVILLDQSYSMGEYVVNQKHSKASIATSVLNKIICDLIEEAGFEKRGEGLRKKYAYLSVLGYNDKVYPLLSSSDDPIDIPTLADNPRGTVPVQRSIQDASGAIRQITEEYPYWIEPQMCGSTQMAEAFKRAHNIVRHWLATPPEPGQAKREYSFPPIIINITDAEHNGSGVPLQVCQEICQGGTEDGKTLIFNCHFTKEVSRPCLFPSSVSEVRALDQNGLSAKMFEMSSQIPESLSREAGEQLYGPGHTLAPGARCFAYNADTTALTKFLHWGTVGAVTGER